MSMYGDYIKEHRNDNIIEDERGFATYRFLEKEKSVYIVDIYVRPEFRKTNVATQMADEIAQIARRKGYIFMLGTVAPSAANSTASLQVLINYGMELHSLQPDLVVFRKEI